MKNRCLYLALGLGLGLVLIGLFTFGGLAAPLQQPADPTPSPAMNAHDVPRDSVVSITYSEAISPATVSTSTFAVHAMQTGLLTETYSVNGGTITLMPPRLFKPDELVQASATTGTLNLSGQGPITPTVWQFRVATGGGTGQFVDSGQSVGEAAVSSDVALGDLNGDGHVDAYLVRLSLQLGVFQDEVWLNDGTGTFVDSGQTLGDMTSNAVALGDLDGDGDLDAFTANEEESNEVWVNGGDGTFSNSGQTLSASDSTSRDVALGDLDGDGDLDALIANSQGEDNDLLWNTGNGMFVDSGQSFGTEWSQGVALGDLDGDGDLDAFVANSGPDQVWLNDGHGGLVLTQEVSRTGHIDSSAVALGDVDHDGDLDAVVANGELNQVNTLWLNDGGGMFSDSGQSLSSGYNVKVTLGDLDGDGDLDIVFARDTNTADRVYLNQGGLQDGTLGQFAVKQSLTAKSSGGVALADLDGDGDLDIYMRVENTYDMIWMNQNRADLAIVKSVNAPTASPGQRITYTLSCSNLGPQVATGIVVSDTVPDWLTDVRCSSELGAITPTGSFSCTWDVADLASGEGYLIYVSGIISTGVEVGETSTNTASITSTLVADLINGNDRSSVGVIAVNKVYLPLVVRNYP